MDDEEINYNDDVTDQYHDLINLTNQRGLKIGHINVNGLKQKLSEISLLLNTVKLDLLAISETHLTSSVSNNQINIDGYNMVRSDRCDGRRGGGTLIYYHERLTVFQMNFKIDIDCSWLDILIKNQRVLAGCMYRPPNKNNFLPLFEKFLDTITIKRKNLVIVGDFNYNISDFQQPNTVKFKNVIFTHNLTNLISQPTRITERTLSTIDLILTISNPTGPKVILSGTHDTGISDHHLIYDVLDLQTPKRKSKIVTVNKIEDKDSLINDFTLVPWHILEIFDDIDDVTHHWHYLFSDILKDHVKTLKLKKRDQNKPWIDRILRKELNQRYKMLCKAKRTNNPDTWRDYKTQRNKCKRLLMKAESTYWKDQFETTNSPKTFWKTVNSYQGKTIQSNNGTIVKNNIECITDADKANTLNIHFAKIGSELHTENLIDDNSQIYRVTPIAPNLKLDYRQFEKAFNHIKVGKANGQDNIKSDYLREIGPENSGLYNVIKRSIQQGKFPTQWKVGKASCLHKKGSKQDPNNYRHITLLSIPSKVLEKMIFIQLSDHFAAHNILCDNQWGFRTGRSTESIILKMTEQWNRSRQ